MIGGFVSATVTRVLRITGVVTPSDTITLTMCDPRLYVWLNGTLADVGGPAAGTESTWMLAPSTSHVSVRASRSRSSTSALSVTAAPSADVHSVMTRTDKVTVGCPFVDVSSTVLMPSVAI